MGESEARLVFATAFEGLYSRGLKGRVDEQLRNELRAIGVDLDRELLPAYPFATWVKALRTTSQRLYPALSIEDGTAELGRVTMSGIAETPLGLAMVGVIRLMGPSRMLKRMTRNLQNGANYVETRVVEEADRAVKIRFSVVAEAGFYKGLLGRGVELAGANGVEVQICAREGESCTYDVRWR